MPPLRGRLNASLTLLSTLALLTTAREASADPIRSAPRYTISEMGFDPGHPIGKDYRFRATDLNNQGEVLGYFGYEGGPVAVYRDGTYHYTEGGTQFNDLGQIAEPRDIDFNNRGAAIRPYFPRNPDGTGSTQAVYVSPAGRPTVIDMAGASNLYAWAINDSGQVTGTLGHKDGPDSPFFFDGTTTHDLGSSFEGQAVGHDINVLGQIVGEADADGHRQGFLYDDGEITYLGMLSDDPLAMSSMAYSINDLGQIVGAASGKPGGFTAILHENGRMFDLAELIPPETGWTLTIARHVNNQGQILGLGELNGEDRYFLLTPTAVPEPASLACFAAVAVFLAVSHARRQRVSKAA